MEKNILKKIGTGKNVSFNTKYGAEIYRSSLTMLMQCAISELYPGVNVQIGQALMKGYFFELPLYEKLPTGFIRNATERMLEIVRKDEKFKKVKMDKAEVIRLYKRKKRYDKINAITYYQKSKIGMIMLRNYFDFALAESVSSTKYLCTFKLVRYRHGFILQFPVRGNILKLPDNPSRQEKLYEIHEEVREWYRILGIRHASDIDRAIKDGTISTLIKVQEAFHEKKIGYIADRIKSSFSRKRLIFVAGPSASGKTTFLKRLGIQIRANGLVPEEISLDDYFVSREKTPKTPDGECDYECLEALDIKFLAKQVLELMNGKEIILPKFNFKTGKREKGSSRLKLKPNSVVLIEGIHGLNPELLKEIDEKSKFKIFVSALTQLSIDNDTRIFTSDSRLMRRIIRDYLFRGYSAKETIKRFPQVRMGEDKYIFPYQDTADVFFNSSIMYEQAIIKSAISKLLRTIKEKEPEYYEARRLLNYFDFFSPVLSTEVPQTSILREFIGESGFDY